MCCHFYLLPDNESLTNPELESCLATVSKEVFHELLASGQVTLSEESLIQSVIIVNIEFFVYIILHFFPIVFAYQKCLKLWKSF